MTRVIQRPTAGSNQDDFSEEAGLPLIAVNEHAHHDDEEEEDDMLELML